VVDTDRSREVYRAWLAKTRDARQVSPNGERRPRWLIRPLKPTAEAFRIGGPVARRNGEGETAAGGRQVGAPATGWRDRDTGAT
jgi:hypothetical protein